MTASRNNERLMPYAKVKFIAQKQAGTVASRIQQEAEGY